MVENGVKNKYADTIPMPILLSLWPFPYPYALPNLPFTSLPFLTIFSYQLICLAGIALRSHRDFPGIGG